MASILRDITGSLLGRLLEVFPPSRAYSVDDMRRGEMPQPILHFIALALKHQAGEELDKLQHTQSPWFDFDHPEVRSAQKTYWASLSAHSRIPSGEWTSLVKTAAQFSVRYLIHPVQTLVDFVFGDEKEALPVHIIFNRMAFFASYSYLTEAVHQFVEKNNLPEIDREQFRTIIATREKELPSILTSSDWIQLLDPLFEMARMTPSLAEQRLPVTLLMTFFQDKSAEEIVRRLDLARSEDGVAALDAQELKEVLETADQEDLYEDTDEETQEDEIEIPPYIAVNARPVPPKPNESTPSVPLWRQFQKSNPPAPRAENRPAPAPPVHTRVPPTVIKKPVPTAPAPGTDAVPLWMRYQNPANKPASSDSLTPLEQSVLGDVESRQREVFVRTLFNGDLQEYERVLIAIQPATSWSQASRIIAQEIFRKHQVDIYSEAAVSFTNAVEARFHT